MRIEQYVQKSLIFAIGSSYDAIWRDFSARLRKEHCNFLQAMILISLVFEKESEAAVTPSRLAETFRTSRANISHCVSDLEKRGLLKRSLDDGDARSYRLTLQPDGRQAALRLIRVIDDFEGFFEKKFGAEEVAGTISTMMDLSHAYREQFHERSDVI